MPDTEHSYESFVSGEYDHFVALASPQFVKDVASEFAAIPASDVNESGGITEREGQLYLDYGGPYFDALRDAYRSAAATGNAIIVVIA